MRHGVVITPVRPWRQLADDFRLMEEIGYDVAYVYDHLTHPTAAGGWLAEAFSTLAAAAGVTTRMELGTLVASATLHSPVSLARRAVTVQDVSGGRLVLGLGAGAPFCAMADRDEVVTPAQMSQRLADVVVGMRAVLAGATQWQGATRSFSGLETIALPEGTEAPFLMLAAHGPKALRLAATHADGWNTYGGPGSTTLDAGAYWRLVGEQVDRFEQACADVGRDPASVRRSLLLGFGTVKPTVGVPAYEDAIGRAEELGFGELVVYGPFGEPGDPFHSSLDVHTAVLS
ncbi:LLM class flavin-dependent oxidoreductase [Nocardioides montaniterrae]